MAKRILVLGASGFIGHYLQAALSSSGHQVTGTYHCHAAPGLVSLDLLDAQAIRKLATEVRPDIVVFAAGTKDVEYCERDVGYAIDQNVQAVRNLLCAVEAAGLVPATLFLSTDYVFDGLRGGYRAGDPVGPRTVYGATKLLAERLMLASGLPGIVLRVSAVMGQAGGFFQWLISSLETPKAVSLFDNTYFSPTTIGHLCSFVTNYAGSPHEHTGTMRIAHLSDGYRMSRYEFGYAVAKRIGKPVRNLIRTQVDLRASTYQADLSLIPDEMQEFFDSAAWNELESIF